MQPPATYALAHMRTPLALSFLLQFSFCSSLLIDSFIDSISFCLSVFLSSSSSLSFSLSFLLSIFFLPSIVYMFAFFLFINFHLIFEFLSQKCKLYSSRSRQLKKSCAGCRKTVASPSDLTILTQSNRSGVGVSIEGKGARCLSQNQHH